MSLIDRATTVFGELSAAEREMLAVADAGEPPSVAFGDALGEHVEETTERTVRAGLVRCLIVDPVASVQHRGIAVSRAKVVGRLDLSRCDVKDSARFSTPWTCSSLSST